jgi:hypothetical protein
LHQNVTLWAKAINFNRKFKQESKSWQNEKLEGRGKNNNPRQGTKLLSDTPPEEIPPEEAEPGDSTSGEQLDLIDITPEHGKEILAIAKDYKKAVSARMRMGEKEVDLKGKLLELIKKENLTRLENGSIRFRLDGMIITVTPRDELIKVKDEADEAEKE